MYLGNLSQYPLHRLLHRTHVHGRPHVNLLHHTAGTRNQIVPVRHLLLGHPQFQILTHRAPLLHAPPERHLVHAALLCQLVQYVLHPLRNRYWHLVIHRKIRLQRQHAIQRLPQRIALHALQRNHYFALRTSTQIHHLCLHHLTLGHDRTHVGHPIPRQLPQRQNHLGPRVHFRVRYLHERSKVMQTRDLPLHHIANLQRPSRALQHHCLLAAYQTPLRHHHLRHLNRDITSHQHIRPSILRNRHQHLLVHQFVRNES
mmetsp:Transcript_13853/g.39828  ORF Transcript_13853/g.39828 Transcript_13853/m.39828 type:complete len:258 (+) Transcript_13853:1894-2667(+)